MKNVTSFLSVCLVACTLLFWSSCKKTRNGPPPTTGAFSFANAEYTGIANVGNHYYPRPVSIRFNADSSMSIFSFILLNSEYSVVKGKVTNVAVNAQGQTEVTVVYGFPASEKQFNGPQMYTIAADKTTITGGAFPLYEIVGSLKLFPAKAPSVAGTWNAPNGFYPDVAGMSFGTDSTATYVYNGKILTYGDDPTTAVHIGYKQDGGRLNFYGVNVPRNEISLKYYGVLTPDGNTMYLDSYQFNAARLPSIYGGSEIYGTIGLTPSMKRQ